MLILSTFFMLFTFALQLLFWDLDFQYSGTMEDLIVTIVTGLMLLLAIGATIFLGSMMFVFNAWARKKLLAIDAALVPLGQSIPGKYAHTIVEGFAELIDDQDDRLIIKAADLLYKTLPETQGLITREQMAEAANTVVTGLAQLLDGVKQTDTEATPPS